MESAEKPIQDLHKEVSGLLKQSSGSVDPEAPHEELTRNLQAVIGSTIEEKLGVASTSVNDRHTKGKIATLIDKIKRIKRAA